MSAPAGGLVPPMFMKEAAAGHQGQLAYNAACPGFGDNFIVMSSLEIGGRQSGGHLVGPTCRHCINFSGEHKQMSAQARERVLMSKVPVPPTPSLLKQLTYWAELQEHG